MNYSMMLILNAKIQEHYVLLRFTLASGVVSLYVHCFVYSSDMSIIE